MLNICCFDPGTVKVENHFTTMAKSGGILAGSGEGLAQ